MAKGDFNIVRFGHNFTASDPNATRSFPIEGAPIDDGYVLVRVRGVGSSSHRILFNGREIPESFDLVPAPGGSQAWRTWMAIIPRRDELGQLILQSGTNTMRIERVGNDNFEVNDVVVHWREPG